MKKCVVGLILCMSLAVTDLPCQAQSEEAQQLLLNVEKLAQLKKILNNMYTGYKILTKGYNAIKDISEGNFDLHKTFLDGLLNVSPTVRKYKRVSDIITWQTQLMKEYKSAFKYFKNCGSFSDEEIEYLGKVYSGLFSKSLKSLDDLAMVVTANKLRMSDDERLQAIDQIYQEVQSQLSFLRSFNNDTKLLSVQRELEVLDINRSRKLNGLLK